MNLGVWISGMDLRDEFRGTDLGYIFQGVDSRG